MGAMGMKWFSLGMRKKHKSSTSSAGSFSSSPSEACSRHVSLDRFSVAADLLQLFDDFDADGDGDGDGRISSADLESLHRIGAAGGYADSAGAAASMVSAADSDGDGFISLEEFASVCCGAGGDEARRAEDLRGAFTVYDRDGDGLISAEELHQVLSGVMGEGAATVEECRGMIREVDSNGDGAVSFDEFERMMTRSSLPPLRLAAGL